MVHWLNQQARKTRSYASPKQRPTHLLTYSLTGVKCRATSVAKKQKLGKRRGGNPMLHELDLDALNVGHGLSENSKNFDYYKE